MYEVLAQYRSHLHKYQKYILNSVAGNRVGLEHIPHITEYLRANYFNNQEHIFLNNQSFINYDYLLQIKILQNLQSKSYLVQFFNQEQNLLIQVLKISEQIIVNLSNQGLNIFSSTADFINKVEGPEVRVCEYYDQDYTNQIIDFLLNRVMIMNW